MSERFFLTFSEGKKNVFINLLQVCRAEIGLEDGKPKCVLTLADREQEIFTDGPAMILVLKRLSELSVTLALVRAFRNARWTASIASGPQSS